MTNETISLNGSFKDLLQCVEGNNVKRKELINMAVEKLGLTSKQAQGLVARNVHRLQQKALLEASGDKGDRTYHISSTLRRLIEPTEALTNGHLSEPEAAKGNEELLDEEIKTQVSLEMILSELNAYRDIQERFPRSRSVVKGLLNETKKESIQLYGRLNALKKVIEATNQRSALEC